MIVWLNLARPRQPAVEWTEWTPSKYCKKHFLDWTWLSRVEIEHRTVGSRQWTVGSGGDKRDIMSNFVPLSHGNIIFFKNVKVSLLYIFIT